MIHTPRPRSMPLCTIGGLTDGGLGLWALNESSRALLESTYRVHDSLAGISQQGKRRSRFTRWRQCVGGSFAAESGFDAKN